MDAGRCGFTQPRDTSYTFTDHRKCGRTQFLRHYWQPRREACLRLGEQITEVFDGRRAPTPEERLHALIARVPIGFHWHLMQRDATGDYAREAIATAEREAD